MGNVPVTCTWSHSKFGNISRPFVHYTDAIHVQLSDAETKKTSFKKLILFFFVSSLLN